MRTGIIVRTLAVLVMGAGLASTFSMQGCQTAPSNEKGRTELSNDVANAMKQAETTDPTLKGFLDKAYGYAIFPSVGKGGLGVGGAYGRGEVYEQGKKIGYCDLSQATIGLQAGGQAYTEIIAFQDKHALDNFKGNKFKFAAQATAVALKSGAGANAKYTDGVSVMTVGEKGLMAEASVGGQKFSFQPL